MKNRRQLFWKFRDFSDFWNFWDFCDFWNLARNWKYKSRKIKKNEKEIWEKSKNPKSEKFRRWREKFQRNFREISNPRNSRPEKISPRRLRNDRSLQIWHRIKNSLGVFFPRWGPSREIWPKLGVMAAQFSNFWNFWNLAKTEKHKSRKIQRNEKAIWEICEKIKSETDRKSETVQLIFGLRFFPEKWRSDCLAQSRKEKPSLTQKNRAQPRKNIPHAPRKNIPYAPEKFPKVGEKIIGNDRYFPVFQFFLSLGSGSVWPWPRKLDFSPFFRRPEPESGQEISLDLFSDIFWYEFYLGSIIVFFLLDVQTFRRHFPWRTHFNFPRNFCSIFTDFPTSIWPMDSFSISSAVIICFFKLSSPKTLIEK